MIWGLSVGGQARFQALRQGQNGGMGSSLKPASKCPNARKSEIVVIFLAAIRPMRQLFKGYALSQRGLSARPAVDGRIPQNQWPSPRTGCNVGRWTFGYWAGCFPGPPAAFLRGFWTSKGIFAQRWGLSLGLSGSLFEQFSALAVRRQSGACKEMR
jgi:hypothetical protein